MSLNDSDKTLLLIQWALRILELVLRSLSGKPVTDEELKKVQAEWTDGVAEWDAAGKAIPPPEPPEGGE